MRRHYVPPKKKQPKVTKLSVKNQKVVVEKIKEAIVISKLPVNPEGGPIPNYDEISEFSYKIKFLSQVVIVTHGTNEEPHDVKDDILERLRRKG